ncbi:DUF2993 domain-containing protein [Geodermatophilus sp. YIM 151500]|uniref:LmeA family phospholipid-binding protein n=1 Tax=Geodermatophilus sp. YIM 151500 TaxID=2984531 RepID=UPI0021E42697|nr:DUF2993 domain-containing protein [Geodermatophilus sp. YIM 151500]MCV2490371.1 DUF2993 domain-containing protein [Geodermatophilus sp. YIM 151500]
MTAGPAPAPHASPARRSRVRVAVLLVSAVIGVAVLLWGGDRLARDVAERLVAREVQRVTGTFATPQVQVHGASFLLQAVRGRYDRVDVTARGLSSGALRLDRVEATLTGVRVPFRDLLLRDPDVLVVEETVERALLSYPDLNRYLQFTSRPYTVRPADDPAEVEITGTVQVLGRNYDATVDAGLGAEGGALTVTPSRVDTGSDLDAAAELLLGERFTFLVPLDPLPFGQVVTDVAVEEDGVLVRAAGEDVVVELP